MEEEVVKKLSVGLVEFQKYRGSYHKYNLKDWEYIYANELNDTYDMLIDDINDSLNYYPNKQLSYDSWVKFCYKHSNVYKSKFK